MKKNVTPENLDISCSYMQIVRTLSTTPGRFLQFLNALAFFF